MQLASRFRRIRARRWHRHLNNSLVPAMTLLELTIVILIMLSLIGILAIGAKTWKKGSDRSICIMNLQIVQKGVRSFANLYGYEPGAEVAGLEDRLIGDDGFIKKMPLCPGEGSYASGGDLIPSVGALYLNCSLAGTGEHEPTRFEDW